MTLCAYGKTDCGLLRSNNEDSFFLDEQLGLFVVADGMGGHAAGEVASQMAIDVVHEKVEPLSEGSLPAEQIQLLLADAVREANRSITRAAAENESWSGMGTTLTILLFCHQQAHLAHVGDSRLYLWRNNTLQQISKDQTLVADQVRRGVLNQAEAEQSTLGNILLQAIGVSEELEIDQITLELQADDCFLLCSDGLTGMLSDTQISEILFANKRPQQAGEKLIAAALEAGGKDNVTAVLVTAAHK